MDLLHKLDSAIERQDHAQVYAVVKNILSTRDGGLALTPDELQQLCLEMIDWLDSHGDKPNALALCLTALDHMERGGADKLAIAQVKDRLAALYLSNGKKEAAANVLEGNIAATRAIEGEESDAVRFRVAMLAEVRGAASASTRTITKHSPADTQSRTPRVSKDGSEASFELVKIYFATHRDRSGRTNPYDFFRGKRDLSMTLGSAIVSVPHQRRVGELPLPPSWMEEARANPARYFVIKTISVSSKDAFWKDIRGDIGALDGRGEALVFIHGYNTSFASALLRTAQLAADLEINGAAVLYSWPSKGNVLSYLMDKNEAIAPLVSDLTKLLCTLARETGAKRVHLVAHSMGCEFLLRALEHLQTGVAASREPPFAEIVFAAPDVDASDFTQRVVGTKGLGHRMTVYSSSNDRALKWSEWANGEPRAGSSPEYLLSAGIDCVDTSNTQTDALGHGNFSMGAIDDLRSIVWLSLKPERRRGLRPRRSANGTYWVLEEPSAKNKDAVRQALLWARRVGVDKAIEALGGRSSGPSSDIDERERRASYAAIFRELQYFKSA